MLYISSSNSAPLYNVDLAAYIGASVLGAYIWDVFSNIGYDFNLLFGSSSNVNIPLVVYFLSRISTLLLSAFTLNFNVTSDITRCAALYTVTLWTTAASVSTTSLLFLLRVQAVYKHYRTVCIFFFLSWVCVVAAAVTQTQLGHLVSVQNNSQRCTVAFNATYFVVAATVFPMINDILVFLAITHRMMATALVDASAVKTRAMIAVFGRHLPVFSKTLLQDGQAYFVTLIPIYITVTIYLILPRLEFLTVLLTYDAVVIANLMACKIYRKTRLGIRTTPDGDTSPKPTLPIVFARRPSCICEG